MSEVANSTTRILRGFLPGAAVRPSRFRMRDDEGKRSDKPAPGGDAGGWGRRRVRSRSWEREVWGPLRRASLDGGDPGRGRRGVKLQVAALAAGRLGSLGGECS